MPAQIALSLVWILVGPQERKETVKGQSPKCLLMFNICVGAVLMLWTDAANDEAQIHPHSFCKRCYDAMQRKLKAVSQHRHFNSRMELYKWEAHASDGGCKVRSNEVVTLTNLHNLHSNHRFVTIL